MSDLIRFVPGLPAVPIPLPSIEGENLDPRALMLRPGYRSAEGAVAQFRSAHAPESLRWYRRYYLAPGVVRDGVRRYAVRYAWNLERPKTDRTVGIIEGDDIAAARVLIGNGVADAWMTPIRWELCEDRDGENPIAIGRFDAWSLLQDVTPADIARLAAHDLAPQLGRWDFDHLFFERQCPGCGATVRVNMWAFNIDSAQCIRCGIRPFLSQAIGASLRHALPSVTGVGDQVADPDRTLLHVVGWMGDVRAATSALHREELPSEHTPLGVLQGLLVRSRALSAGCGGGECRLVPAVVERLRGLDGGEQLAVSALAATDAIAGVLTNGGQFTEVHAAMARMLLEVARSGSHDEP